jgi:hypothetical protein
LVSCGEAILVPTRNGQFSLPIAFVAEIEEGGTIKADHG